MQHLSRLTLLSLCLSLLASCSRQSEVGSKTTEVALANAREVVKRGAALGDAPRVTLETLVAAPAAYEGKTVVVSGTARRVCQAKGCWMELAASPDKTAPSCRVAFKDYAFFVPKDSAGKSVTAEGLVELKRLSKDHVDHYEAEGAVFSSKNEDGSANELRLVASGLELR